MAEGTITIQKVDSLSQAGKLTLKADITGFNGGRMWVKTLEIIDSNGNFAVQNMVEVTVKGPGQ